MFVTETTGLAIASQKTINHQRVLMLEIVLVYFPITKTGQSHKFTSFWMGPFEIIEIIPEVLLKIKKWYK